MLRFGFGILASLSLLVSAFLLWQSPEFPESLPGSMSAWVAAWFELFRHPVSGGLIVAACAALIVFAQCVTEILLGLLFSAAAFAASLLCLIGFLGVRFPALSEGLVRFFQ